MLFVNEQLPTFFFEFCTQLVLTVGESLAGDVNIARCASFLIGEAATLSFFNQHDNLCNISGLDNPPCVPIATSKGSVSGASLSSASAVRSSDKLFLRIAETQKAAVLSFALGRFGELKPEQTATDAPYITRFSTVTGFSRGKYTYFVGSAFQPYEPLINANLGVENRTVSKITRICSSDITPDLESRMDLAIICDDESTNQKVEAALYDAKNDQLVVVMANTTLDVTNRTVCVFSMTELERRFDLDWSLCQKTTFHDGGQVCEAAMRESDLEDHCYVFTRRTDAFRMQTCTRFGQDVKRIYDNCNLHEHDENTYRYGWLEDFRPFEGKVIGRVDTKMEKVVSVVPDDLHDALFLAGRNGGSTVILRIPKSKDSQLALSPVLWQKKSSPHSRFPLGLSKDGDTVFILNSTLVSVVHISCSGLYSTCEDIVEGGWLDPLSCMWCPDESRQVVISSYDKFSCSHPIATVCPPTVDQAICNDNQSEWELFGSHFDRMEDIEVFVCDEKCTVNRQLSSTSKLQCVLPSGSMQDPNCNVRVVGRLGGYEQFTVNARKTTHSIALMTDQSQFAAKSSRSWKIVLAVIVVVIILVALGIIICLARKKMKSTKDGADVVTASNPLSDVLRSGHYTNKYDACLMDFISPYEQMFKDIDERLKIDVSRLEFENEIGRGHFGIVSKATYAAPDGSKRKVACKILKQSVAGIGDFIIEGLTMDRFDHPNLMQLVGIALTDGRLPIIVTDFMENGDLRSYLRDEKKVITLRSLLRFACQIADGMKHLHMCRSVHCDLAARNCMLDTSLNVKIGDFGLCRRVSDESEAYEPSHKHRDVPFPWMAPETMSSERFTFQNDVWAYGVVLWELTTRGLTPYGGKKGIEILEFLRSNKRLDMPEYCPAQLYNDIMLPCWDADPQKRPTFADLVILVNNLIVSMESSKSQQLYRNYEKLSSLRTDSTATHSNGLANLY
ncbi:hypothetical protein Q1695_000064 [Nippostrongylus brasiliensis]|nr:hypothetical protein Q1695_000064 [Nippostrongylus brasiliensis]